MVQYSPKTENLTGASFSGSSGDINRTYTLANANSISAGMRVLVQGRVLHPTAEYTFSNGIVTIITPVLDAYVITIDYFVTVSTTTQDAVGYSSTLQVVRVSGVGVEVVDENVGTGDNSSTSFDLDNGNVIANSYSFYHAASGSNNMTSLTETTHYTIDKDAGRILLTAAGVTALGTNILWAKYTHSPKMSDTVITNFLPAAEKEVDFKTGNYWGPVKTSTEYFNGRKTFEYPTTDEPYASDWDEPDTFQLVNEGVQNLVSVAFLSRGTNLSAVYSYDDSGASYTNNTTEANTQGGTAFYPFASTTAANDYLYIGSSYKFLGVSFNFFNVGVTSGTNTIEYYDGSSWTAFTPTESTTGVLDMEAAGKLSWSDLASWSKTTVNSSSSLYWVRIKAASTYSTEARVNSITMNQNGVIMQEPSLSSVDVDENGNVTFLNTRLPNGTRNVKISYSHGYSSTPAHIAELTALLAGIRVYANITGGSYDDATSYTLGPVSVSIGEVYVNVREVVRQFEVRIQSILKDVGERYSTC